MVVQAEQSRQERQKKWQDSMGTTESLTLTLEGKPFPSGFLSWSEWKLPAGSAWINISKSLCRRDALWGTFPPHVLVAVNRGDEFFFCSGKFSEHTNTDKDGEKKYTHPQHVEATLFQPERAHKWSYKHMQNKWSQVSNIWKIHAHLLIFA